MFQADLFAGQVALVTGGGTGIGYTIAEQLLRHGAQVFIASRKLEHLEPARDRLAEWGNCEHLVCDIRDTAQVAQLAEQIKQRAGRLDLLVNNAGGQFPSLAADLNERGWNAVINNNLNGTFYVTQQCYQTFFAPQQSGVIINIIVNIYRGVPGMAHTGAARAGIDNLTKSLAVEWSRQGIRVNAVAPGIIQSSGLDHYPEEMKRGIADTIPLQRLGTTEEVAHLVLFLASPGGQYITGETVYVDGGQRLWGHIFPL